MTALEEILREQIAAHGSLPFSEFMWLCLQHPQHGYYITHNPLGEDFTTSPEISQLFGEMIGLWCIDAWMKMGAPQSFVLAEGGPGRGTLMADVLRTAKVVPAFLNAAQIVLLESSPALRKKQAEKLRDYKITWAENPEELPAFPLIFVANELFDAFPIRRFVRMAEGWKEEAVTVKSDQLAFTTLPLSKEDEMVLAAPAYTQAPLGAYAEFNDEAAAWIEKIAGHIAAHKGAALIIDYGYEGSLATDTAQAIYDKKSAPLLENPGEADLTTHVDFTSMRRAAEAAGLKAPTLRLQRDFLVHCGILQRAKMLGEKASPQQKAVIETGLERLISANHMGALFKVFAAAHPSLPPLLGF